MVNYTRNNDTRCNNPSVALSRAFGAIGTLFWVLNGSLAHAAMQCYDFSGPEVGTQYDQASSPVDAGHSVVHIGPLYDEDDQQLLNTGYFETSAGDVTQAGAPSLIMRGGPASVEVVPDQRVQRVTMKYAENIGTQGVDFLVNFGVNGDLRVWRGTLADEIDGVKMGSRDSGGRVDISVTAHENPESAWIRGSITLESAPIVPISPNRGIESIIIGRQTQLALDEFCIEI